MKAEAFECWALVELFGHQRIAGKVTTQEVGGASFIRVDAPRPDGNVAFTRLFGSAAIYSISPIDEETCRRIAGSCGAEPVKAWELPALPAPREPYDETDTGDEEDNEGGK